MDNDILNALLKVNTSSQWSTLDSVLTKVNKTLNKKIEARTLGDFLLKSNDYDLNQHGIWITSFGKNYMPIVLTNRAYARARSICGDNIHCTCGIENHTNKNKNEEENNKNRAVNKINKYFKSMDYNAGRHATDNSAHKANCPSWRPPSSSHLHSWRRNF